MRRSFIGPFVIALVVSTIYAQHVCGQTIDTRPATTQALPPVVIQPWHVTTEDPSIIPHAGVATFGIGVDGFSTFSGERDTLLLPSLSAGLYITKSVSINFDVGVSDVDYQFGQNGFDGSQMAVHDIGGVFMLRKVLWHNNDILLSADVGVGAIHADSGFPKYFETDQIVRTIGLVTDIRLNQSTFLTLGARYARFANDFLDRSPSRGFNGMNYYVGLKFVL